MTLHKQGGIWFLSIARYRFTFCRARVRRGADAFILPAEVYSTPNRWRVVRLGIVG